MVLGMIAMRRSGKRDLACLAAQVRFGGRTGAAPFILGACKLAAGLLFGSSLLTLLLSFPQALLGAMLVFSGTAPQPERCWHGWCLLGLCICSMTCLCTKEIASATESGMCKTRSLLLSCQRLCCLRCA